MGRPDVKSLSTAELLYEAHRAVGQDFKLHYRDLLTLRDRFNNEGLPFLTQTLPLLSKAMLKGLGTGHFQLPNNFKSRRRNSEIPAFLGALFARVFHENGKLRDNACPVSIIKIRQFCELSYKADVPRDPSKDEAVIDSFVRVEEELSNLDIAWDPLLVIANSLVKRVVEDYDRKDCVFKHGPGVTANTPIVSKYEQQLAPLPSVSSFGSSFFFNENDALTRLNRYPDRSHFHYFSENLENVAKVILVPKDSRGPRLISCEPAENQWVQQGIRGVLEKLIEKSPYTGGHINFDDQSINQRLVMESSITREYSTLDLKDASDRVSLSLVSKLFSGTNLLQDLLVARSSKTMLPDGRVVQLNKHAPMGSALCFPVMSLSLWSILAAMIFIETEGNIDEAISSVYVFGDDIVIKTKYADLAVSALETYSLRVNRDKSFIDSNFLESCGCDAFSGVDVTPIRIKQCQTSTNLPSQNPNSILGLLAAANALVYRSPRAANFLFSVCEYWLGPLPYGYTRSPYLCRVIPEEIEYVPEMNSFTQGVQMFRRKTTDRNPLGVVLNAWAVKPIVTKGEASAYGHMMRTWSQIGSGDPIAGFGEFTLPRSFKLTKRLFGWDAMSPITPSNWLPLAAG